MDLRVKRLHPDAKLPTRATDGSAGLDLYFVGTPELGEDEECTGRLVEAWVGGATTRLETGISVEIPAGHVGLLCLRSSMSREFTIPNGLGIIDADFRGELQVALRCHTSFDGMYIKPGDRIAQLVIVPVLQTRVVEVEELGSTPRGTGGFGSTGK